MNTHAGTQEERNVSTTTTWVEPTSLVHPSLSNATARLYNALTSCSGGACMMLRQCKGQRTGRHTRQTHIRVQLKDAIVVINAPGKSLLLQVCRRS